jgi:hypothetical protein
MTTLVIPLAMVISGVEDGALIPATDVEEELGSSEVHDTSAAIAKTAMTMNLI